MVVGSFLTAIDLDDVWDILCGRLELFKTALVSSVGEMIAYFALVSIGLQG